MGFENKLQEKPALKKSPLLTHQHHPKRQAHVIHGHRPPPPPPPGLHRHIPYTNTTAANGPSAATAANPQDPESRLQALHRRCETLVVQYNQVKDELNKERRERRNAEVSYQQRLELSENEVKRLQAELLKRMPLGELGKVKSLEAHSLKLQQVQGGNKSNAQKNI